MRNLLSLFASLSLISSSSISVISCSDTPQIYGDCFDEDGNNVTDKGSDSKQWSDMLIITLAMAVLPKDKFPDSASFQQINDKTSDELINSYFKTSSGEIWADNFDYNFTFLITEYDSISNIVISKMQATILQDKLSGIYLFLNLPGITIENIKSATDIDFQLIFITKNSDGSIIGNTNNSWFYWYDVKVKNEPDDNQKYFFNFNNEPILDSQHVVTRYSQSY